MNISKDSRKYALAVTGQKGKIRSGDIVHIKIIRRLTGNQWQISVGGKLISVTTTLPLTENTIIKTRAVWSGNQLLLHLFHPKRLWENIGFGERGLKEQISQKIISALLRSKMPVKPETVAFIKKNLSSQEFERETMIRFLTLLKDKQLTFPPETLSNISTLFLLREKLQQDEHKRKQYKREKGNDSEEDGAQELEKTEIETLIAQNITKRIDKSSSPLALFNHIRAQHDNWIIIPYSLQVSGAQYRGTVRFRTHPQTDTIRETVIHLRSESSEWFFLLLPSKANKKKMIILCDTERVRKKGNAMLKNFSEKLRKLGIEIVDTIKETGMFDGFSSETFNDVKNIDTIV